MSYYNCENITKKLLEKNHFEGNKALLDFIAYSKKTFTRKKQAMKILENISELNNEGIILKDSGEHKEEKNEKEVKKEKKKTLIQSTRKKEEKESENELSLIQTDSLEDNMDMNEKKNELEISMVGPEKLEKKKKNVSEIQSLIKKCTEDINNLDILVKKYKYSSKDLIMQSEIIDDKSMIFITKKDFEETNDEDFEKKANYFNDIKNKFILLKKRLENLLSMYNSEKELTEIKKRELEKLELLNNKYNELKRKQYEKRK